MLKSELHLRVHHNTIHNSDSSMNRQRKCGIHAMKYRLAIKRKNETLSLAATRMELKNPVLSAMSSIERRVPLFSLTCGN
jgi:hypothetical protein